MKKIKILDVQFDVCTKDEALKRAMDIFEYRASEEPKYIVTPNPEILLEAQKNTIFREVLNRAYLSIPDGIGILWASTFQKITKGNGTILRFIKAFFSLLSVVFLPKFCEKVFPERISGVDFMESLCSMSISQKIPIFLLGAESGVAEKVKNFLETRYSGINIVGTFSASPLENDFPAIQTLIAETQPQMLFVAYGSPSQELWIFRHLKDLPSVKISMGVGGAFDFLAGVSKRAPQWMRKIGIEWLYRLIQEPSRIQRIWNAVVKFPWTILVS